jgi:KDO2-lipid IV(A) lauroyltransferase
MARPKRPLVLDYLENLPQRLMMGFLRLLPFDASIRLGGWVGRRLICDFGLYRGRIEKNLRRIYPDMEFAQRKDLMAGIATTFGRSFAEYFQNSRFRKRLDRYHASGPGLDHLKAAQAEGRGAILVSGHFGQVEAVRAFLNAEGMHVGSIYRPQNNPFFEADLLREITQAGDPMFPTTRKGERDMIRHVRSGGVLSVLNDQSRTEAPRIDFLGEPAHTALTAANLALRYDVPLIPVYGTRQEDLSIDVEFEDPIPPSDAETMTARLNDSLSARVRAHPEQWFWMHRRWK